MKNRLFEIKLFLIYFSIATALAILFQMVIAPYLLATGGGRLIGPDNLYFQDVAVQLAEKISREGWRVWSANPANGATGNVALLGALYNLVGVDSLIIVPVNAGLHAISGVLIFVIAKKIWLGRLGAWVGALAATIFILTPSSILWYGQVHKDGYYIAGLLFVLYSWVEAGDKRVGFGKVLFNCSLGFSLCAFVRPYALSLILLGLVGLYSVLILKWLHRSYFLGDYKFPLKQLLPLVVGVLFLTSIPSADIESQPYLNWNGGLSDHAGANNEPFRWESTSWVPDFIDRRAEVIAKTRVGLIYHSQLASARSNIDEERRPNNFVDMLLYVPRALQISLFAPFPDSWSRGGASVGWFFAVVEMLFWYFFLVGILIKIAYRNNSNAIDLVLFCLVALIICGITTANIGTLHRLRFPYISILILVGVGGWMEYFQRNWSLMERLNVLSVSSSVLPLVVETGESQQARKTIAKSGLLVLVCTAMTFLGFFVRDVMMARMYGLGHDLDAFVLAGVVPMFMVSAFSVPLGAAVIPFIEGQKITSRNALSGFIQRLSLLYLLFTAIVSISFYCGGRYMLHSSDWGSGLSLGDLDKVEFLSLWMLAIFVVSGFLTIANGVLSSFERPYLAAVAQLLVPAVVIVALVLLGDSVGVIVVPIAMFVGQVLNLIFLIRWLAQEDIFLWPFRFEISIPNAFGRQYFPLVIGTIFMQITVPVSTILAASLQSGDLAALGLGGKLVIFLTGLITAGLASVVLPYFANLLVQKRVIDARRELSFLLLSATVFSVPLTILLYFFSGGIVKIFFEGGVFNGDNAQLVTSVMEFGALQLPFFFVNTIMLKYAIAMQRSGWVLMASLVGLLINVFLNFILSRLNGVAGVSLAMSISVAVTAGLMLVVFLREKEVAWLDFIYILINWMLFISLIICLHYSSWAGVFSAFLAYSLLLYGEWQAVSRGRDIYVAA